MIKIFKLTALILLGLLDVNCQTYNEATVFTNKADLKGTDYKLEWDYTTSDIVFRATVKTTGWVGFGLSPNGRMANSDVILSWAASDGSIQFKDAHTNGYSVSYDTVQNWQRLFYSQKNGVTTVIFKRSLKVCSSNQPANEINIEIGNQAQNVIFAWSTNFGMFDNFPAYHGLNKGAKLLQLRSSDSPIASCLSATTPIAITNGLNFTIPTVSTFTNPILPTLPALNFTIPTLSTFTKQDPCTSNQCQNGATCIHGFGIGPSYRCLCPNGYEGRSCEIDSSLTCTKQSCLNGGSCSIVSGKTFCTCRAFFTGYSFFFWESFRTEKILKFNSGPLIQEI